MANASTRQKQALKFLKTKYPEATNELLNGREIEALSGKEAYDIIAEINRRYPRKGKGGGGNLGGGGNDKMKHNYPAGSKSAIIADALIANDMNVDRTQKAIAETGDVGRIPALTFGRNLGNGQGREPLELGHPDDDTTKATQYGRLRVAINNMKRQLLNGGGELKNKLDEGENEIEEDKLKDIPEDERVWHDFLAWVRQCRAYCASRKADGHSLDSIGLRWIEYGARALKQDIPVNAIKDSLTMHWPPEARSAVGVKKYDIHKFGKKDRIEGMNAALPMALALSDDARIPVAFVGDKGTGKTTLAKQIAEILTERHGRNFPFGFVSMTAGTSPSAFNGRPRVTDDGTMGLVLAMIGQATIEDDPAIMAEALNIAQEAHKRGDTVMSLFCKIFGGGGVWLFDEFDAGEPNLQLTVNAALANGYFANPVTGEIIEQHPDFRPIAAMNTVGLGAGRDYTGRMRQDAAALDRWFKIRVELDEALEEKIFWDIFKDGKTEEVAS